MTLMLQIDVKPYSRSNTIGLKLWNNTLIQNLLKQFEYYLVRREVGFALFKTILHWSFECLEGSIPFNRSTSPPFILNGLKLR